MSHLLHVLREGRIRGHDLARKPRTKDEQGWRGLELSCVLQGWKPGHAQSLRAPGDSGGGKASGRRSAPIEEVIISSPVAVAASGVF